MPTPRICPHCGTVNEANVTFCGACATQLVKTTAIVPVSKRPLLPALSPQQKATLGGVVVGAVAVAVRVGAEILKQAARPAPQTQPLVKATRPRDDNTIIVRRRWMTGDNNGQIRWGEEEIEIDRPTGDDTSYTVKF
jgi:hypothetical protein